MQTQNTHMRLQTANRSNPGVGLDLHKLLKKWQGRADWIGLRLMEQAAHVNGIRNGRPKENILYFDKGLMVEVMVNGQFSYSGTCDLSPEGLDRAFQKALDHAKWSSPFAVTKFTQEQRPKAVGQYQSPTQKSFDKISLAEISDFLLKSNQRLRVSDQIINAESEVTLLESTYSQVASNGSDFTQNFNLVYSNFAVVSKDGNEIQRRSLNGPVARCLQGGIEALNMDRILDQCESAGREALALLKADNCPSDTRDLLLAPDQMYIQIHESIGHPLEYDRILGDERNYAGWSFVKAADFGQLQYGSPLLNVSFDPTVQTEFASYGFDDCGNPAKKEYLIKDGKLLRGLGSLESQARLNLPGVANFRSSSWNRAPIDRMANINVEPGQQSFEQMISSVEKGIYMQANISWSIDDYRRKFQFGCEYAQLIENGKLTKVVKNPNYRGISVPFWNSLKAVGSNREVEIYGTPFCGKGEPSQAIRVGHAAPPCLFANVEVFGGGQ